MSVKGRKPHVLFRAVPNRSTYCPVALRFNINSPCTFAWKLHHRRCHAIFSFFSPFGCFYSLACTMNAHFRRSKICEGMDVSTLAWYIYKIRSNVHTVCPMFSLLNDASILCKIYHFTLRRAFLPIILNRRASSFGKMDLIAKLSRSSLVDRKFQKHIFELFQAKITHWVCQVYYFHAISICNFTNSLVISSFEIHFLNWDTV